MLSRIERKSFLKLFAGFYDDARALGDGTGVPVESFVLPIGSDGEVRGLGDSHAYLFEFTKNGLTTTETARFPICNNCIRQSQRCRRGDGQYAL